MKNSDYTCDLCHAQISKSEVFVLDLGKMITTRTDPWTFFRYDLCERCAKLVKDKIKQQFVTGGGAMRTEMPLINASKAPEVECYVMGRTLTVERTERVGNATTERRAELQGYLSKEVLESALDMMRGVVEQ